MVKKFVVCILTVVATSASLNAQLYDITSSSNSRLMLGGSYGTFRISYDEFDDIYSGKSETSIGGFGSYLITAPYNVLLKYREFSKTDVFTNEIDSYALDWHQRFYNFGLRYYVPGRKGFNNHFSFGFSVIQIEEMGEYSVFEQEDTPQKNSAGGFFLDLGIHYGFNRFIDAFVEFEITSAGLDGKSGFEGTSVGGYYWCIGLAIVPF